MEQAARNPLLRRQPRTPRADRLPPVQPNGFDSDDLDYASYLRQGKLLI